MSTYPARDSVLWYEITWDDRIYDIQYILYTVLYIMITVLCMKGINWQLCVLVQWGRVVRYGIWYYSLSHIHYYVWHDNLSFVYEIPIPWLQYQLIQIIMLITGNNIFRMGSGYLPIIRCGIIYGMIAWYDRAWYDNHTLYEIVHSIIHHIWCGIWYVACNVVWFHVMYDMVWYGMAWEEVAWHCMTWHHTT